MLIRRLAAWFVALLAFAPLARAQSSYPMLMGISPLAVQQGTTAEVELSARYTMYGATSVIISGEGVAAEVVIPEDWKKYEAALAERAKPQAEEQAEEKQEDKKEDKKDEKPAEPPKRPDTTRLKLQVTIAGDAQPGVRDLRLITPQGPSTIGQLLVTAEPVVLETKDNDKLAGATPFTAPATLCGTINPAEDVDFFKFTAAAGDSLVLHCQSARCQDRIHDLQTHVDPILILRNATGTVLALSDNYFFGDPLLAWKFEQAGDYFVEIRDVRYQGNTYWHYAIEVTDKPFVTQVFPMTVATGSKNPLQLVGYNLPQTTLTHAVAKNAPLGMQSIPLKLGQAVTNPVPLVVTALPVVVESAAAPSTADGNGTVAAAQELPGVPCAVSGCIESAGDVDVFAFAAKKGDRFSFEVIARRHQSELDSNLRILSDQGATLAENDDAQQGRHTYADSMLENWTAPADGTYFVELRDLHLRGGPSYVYHLEVTRAGPTFRLEADTDKTPLYPGLSNVIYVKAYRKNGFAGDIDLAVDGLPAGLTATCGRILASGNDGAIVLTAAADAAPCAANLTITGTAQIDSGDGKVQPLTIAATNLQETYMPGGGRGHYPVDMHTVSLGEPTDIRNVSVSPTEIVLKPGTSQRIDIKIERAEGFTANVTLDCMLRHLARPYGDSLPPGVTIDDKASKTLLSAGQSEGYITLKAAPDCKPVDQQLIAVQAQVAINFVMKMSYSGTPVFVTVKDN